MKTQTTARTSPRNGKAKTFTPPSKPSPPRLERSTFETSRLLEFFSEKELAMQIGHPPELWPLALLKELIDNSLDGVESADGEPSAPRVSIVVEDNALSVQDNGPGIPAETVGRSLDYTSRVSNKAHYVSPTRGALGNALKCVWAVPFVIDGHQGRAEVVAQGIHHDISIAVDRVVGIPIIKHTPAPSIVRKGTFVKVHWSAIASCLGSKTHDSYNAAHLLRAFATFNPHAHFSLTGAETLAARSPRWKKWRPDQPTCSHWYSPESLRNLIAAYVTIERAGGKTKTVRAFVAEVAGLSSTSKTKWVLAEAGSSGAKLSDLVKGEDGDLERVGALLGAMKTATRPVKSTALGTLGEEHLAHCLVRHYGSHPHSVRYKRLMLPKGGNGLPFVLEVAMGVKQEGREGEQREVVVGLNWSPALHPPFDELPRLLGEMRIDEHDPVTLLVHLACPKLGYTDRGKARLALSAEILDALQRCVRKVANSWKKEKRQADRHDRLTQNALDGLRKSRQPKSLSIKTAAYRVMKEAYLETSSDGSYPANARQIMYKARPRVLALTAGKCWKHSSQFTQRHLPDFMKEHPTLTADWDVVFDARGRLVEPHTNLRVDLGTLQVRTYVDGWRDDFEDRLADSPIPSSCPTVGPMNRYGFALFIEKEGFAPLLDRANIAGRFDVAVMSTKGMSVTAARALVESLASKDVTILVLRDFDKAGFSITHTLGNDTRRYTFKTKPRVIDLGLRLSDVRSMGLLSEPVDYKSRSDHNHLVDPRINLRECGASEDECAFLVQRRAGFGWAGERVELNAMSSEQFINFLESKLRAHGVRKLVPKPEVLKEAYRRALAVALVNRSISTMTQAAHEQSQSAKIPSRLEKEVRRLLKDNQSLPWDAAVAQIVAETF